LQGLLYLPVNQTLKLRRDNLILQSVPVMLSSLPPKQAAQQMIKFLEHLRAK
jgi:hypothetical protein